MRHRLVAGRVERVALLTERGQAELRRGVRVEVLGDGAERTNKSPCSRARSRSSSTGSSSLSTWPVACSVTSARSRSTRLR